MKSFFSMKGFFRAFRAKRFLYEPLVKIILSSESLIHNYRVFEQRYAPIRIAPVLKSNAYGHGLIGTAKKFDVLRPPFLVVDSYYEALVLKNEKIQTDVLVIGYTLIENILRARSRGIIFTITTVEQIRVLSKTLRHQQRFHIKIDTGMHRQGISPHVLPEVMRYIQHNKNIIFEGVCSHFADADVDHSSYTDTQISTWNAVCEQIQKLFPHIQHFHIAATAGTAQMSRVYATTARIGIGLYGIDSAEFRSLSLRPVLSVSSILVGIKQLSEGECVGYNATFCASQTMRIGVVPAGYYEGIDRNLSNKGYVNIHGIYCKILGRVNMNMITVDVSDVPIAQEGDRVELISNISEDKNSVVSMARLCNKIPYEILIKIPEKIRRVWI